MLKKMHILLVFSLFFVLNPAIGWANTPPVVANPIPDQTANEDEAFSFAFAENTFSDADGDALAYSAGLDNGGASFDGVDDVITFGTPEAIQIPTEDFSFALRFKALSDPVGGYDYLFRMRDGTSGVMMYLNPSNQLRTSVRGDAREEIINAGDVVINGLYDGKVHSVVLTGDRDGSATLYIDGVDAGSLDISEIGTMGSNAYLHLGFGSTTAHMVVRDFVLYKDKVLTSAEIGDYHNGVITTSNMVLHAPLNETSGLTAADASGNGNDGTVIGVTGAEEEAAFWAANSADALLPLPEWLSFDAAARTFSGTPATGKNYDIRVVADDGAGGRAVDDFVLTVSNVNDAPVVESPINDQATFEGEAFKFTFSKNVFSDEEGDSLMYSASLEDDSALPGWLSFDAGTRTFSGTVEGSAALNIKVTASDGNSSASDVFTLAVVSGVSFFDGYTYIYMGAPVVLSSAADQTWEISYTARLDKGNVVLSSRTGANIYHYGDGVNTRLNADAGGEEIVRFQGSFNRGELNHYKYVFNGTDISLYMDDELIQTKTAVPGLLATYNKIGTQLTGLITAVKIVNNGTTVVEYDLANAAGTTVSDASGSGNAGTVVKISDAAPVEVSDVSASETKISALDAAEGDGFGLSVSIDGDYALAGALSDDDGGNSSGSAYIYSRNEGGENAWGEVKKLTASDAGAGHNFGFSVSLHGDDAMVGARYHHGIGNYAGAAYIFNRNKGGENNWGEAAKLTASDAAARDIFGKYISINGDYAVVGVPQKEDGETTDAGAVYLYYRNQGGDDAWGEIKKIMAPTAGKKEKFGQSVSLEGDYLLVGENQDNTAQTGAGAAHLYHRNEGGENNWGLVKTFTASDAAAWDRFGSSVTLSGDNMMIGAAKENDKGGSDGVVYVYSRNQGGEDNWGEVKILAGAHVGNTTISGPVINGDYALVASGGSTVGDSLNAGVLYVLHRNQGGENNWGKVRGFTNSDYGQEKYFGNPHALSADHIMVGMMRDASAGANSGAAYIYGGLLEAAPVISDDFPQTLELKAGTPKYLQLAGYVSDMDHSVNSLEWSFSVSNDSVTASYDKTTDTLTVNANGDFRGGVDIVCTVTDGDGLFDSDTIKVDVPTSLKELPQGVPTVYALHQNYPNPFNPSTTIVYSLPKAGDVKITLYNIMGQRVGVILNGYKAAGHHEVKFDASHLASGNYFYLLESKDFRKIRKMLLLK
jgi:hypothetical protein